MELGATRRFVVTSLLMVAVAARMLDGAWSHPRHRVAPLRIAAAGLASAVYWCRPANDALVSPLLAVDAAFGTLAAATLLRRIAYTSTVALLVASCLLCYAQSWRLSVHSGGASARQRRCHFAGHLLVLATLLVAAPRPQ